MDFSCSRHTILLVPYALILFVKDKRHMQTMAIRLYQPFLQTLRQQQIIPFLAVFVPVLAVLKLNQYIFFSFNTSPAVILMPVGIGLAAVYLGGYRMWLPIACAWFLALLSSSTQPSIFFVIAATVAYPLQAVIGGYVLRRFNFLGTLERTRCALILIAVALFVPVVAPSITTLALWLTGSLSAPVWVTWSRVWAGSVMSIMVFTPLITTWYTRRVRKTPKELLETFAALTTLTLAVYLTFWTTLPQLNTFVVLYGLFTVLFWIGLRLHPRIVAVALFLTAFGGMAGSIIARPVAIALNQQLLADELFIILIAPIFFILTSLVEERRVVAHEAETRARELEDANRRLSHEDQAKNEFLATLAHEPRNPLAPVVSSLELMKIKAEEINRLDLMQLVETANTHNATLTRLLDDLLDISRISQKKFKLQRQIVELRPIVERALRTVDVLCKSRNHILSVSIPKENLWVEADPLRLEQILVNLLNNAAKYTDIGGHIELSVTCEGERNLRISVKDNGNGIEPHMLGKIFESFVQSSDSNSGLGIGLSLTRRLVGLHGGRVWAQSEGLGKGSEFTVVLPGVRRPQPAPALPAAERRGKAPPLGKRKRPAQQRSILVVDDNRAAAEGLKKLLEHGGHSTAVVYDGLSAIERMRNEEAGVVLLDIGLPDIDGYDVARRLRKEHGYNPLLLIAVTGYGQDEDKAKAKDAGFNYHLTKPVGIADIEALLAKDHGRRDKVR